MVVVPVPARRRPPAGQRARAWSRPAPPGSSRTRRSMPTRCSRRPTLLDDPTGARRDVGRGAGAGPARGGRRRGGARPGRRDSARPLPGRRGASSGWRAGSARDDRRPSTPIATGTDIQRRIGVKTSRDEPLARFTTMRVGGPADLFATVHNAHELRALVRFARARGLPTLHPRARAATSSSPMPGSAAWSSRSGPRARASTASATPPKPASRWRAPRPRRRRPA